MPILGKSGESITTRLFGRPGLQPAGQAIVTANLGAIAKRAKQGLAEPGGILGAKKSTQSSGPNYSPAPNSTPGLNYTPAGGPLVDLKDAGTGGDSGRAQANYDAAIRSSIGAGWEDAEDVLSDTKKSVEKAGKTISQLGKIRDQYLEANDKNFGKTKEAIAGNKELITKHQGKELDLLGEDLRDSIKNASLLLGVKGATGGSASKAASKAISRAAGRNRAGILTDRGNEFSQQIQDEGVAQEQYDLRRKQAYDWEAEQRKILTDELSSALKAISKLKSKSGDYKKKDEDALTDKYLTRFLTGLAEISAFGKTLRDNALAKYAEFGGSVAELENAAIETNAPAELLTPDFDEDIDLDDPENAEDFFDPENKGKKRIVKGYDAFGNPIYEEDLESAA